MIIAINSTDLLSYHYLFENNRKISIQFVDSTEVRRINEVGLIRYDDVRMKVEGLNP